MTSATGPKAAIQQKLQQATALESAGQIEPAVAAYEQILRIDPKNLEALNALGLIAVRLNDKPRAAEWFGKAAKAHPHNAGVQYSRGLALHESGQAESALISFNRAIALKPDYAEAYFCRGNSQLDLNDLQGAIDSYDAAIALDPRYAEAYSNRGVAFKNQHQFAAALESFNRAIEIRPDLAQAYCNRGFTSLLLGDLPSGWPDNEWRYRAASRGGSPGLREIPPKWWTGAQPIGGKTVLLRGEQGFGDSLQFCRYAALVAARGANVILEVQPSLTTLLDSVEGVSSTLGQGQALPDFDYQCLLMSLPLVFGSTLENIPAAQRYIRSDPRKVEQWKEHLGPRTVPRVGLVWSGSTTHTNDRNRSIGLEQLATHLPRGLEYIGVQRDIRARDRQTITKGARIMNTSARLTDFSQTAALCECLDLVISVDTSVAHVSAALGRPTWVLLPFNPDWRWLMDRADSPWYPTMTLHRQSRLGSWTEILQRVGEALRDRFAETTDR